jgi:hypothetical protein
MQTSPKKVLVNSFPSSGECWLQAMRINKCLCFGCLLKQFVLGEMLCHSFDAFPALFGRVAFDTGRVAFDTAESRRHQMTGIATQMCVDVKINKKFTMVRCDDKIAWSDTNACDGLVKAQSSLFEPHENASTSLLSPW